MNYGTIVGNEVLITELFRKKWSIRAIARELKVEPTAISQKLALLGIRRRETSKPRLSTASYNELVKLYESGIPTEELSIKYNLKDYTIRSIVRRLGGKVFQRGNREKQFSDDQIKEIARLYLEVGLSQIEIANKFNTTQILISRLLRRNDFVRSNKNLNHPTFKGGRTTNSEGYVNVLVSTDHHRAAMRNSQGYVLEHRLAMAESLGRDLLPTETVHHINGKRDDNRLENLQLRQGNHGKGEVHQCADCGSFNIKAVALAETS